MTTIMLAVALLVAPAALEAQSRESNPPADLDEDGQLRRLPPLPKGMTLALIRQGDSLFRGRGGCVTCHGPDAEGVPASGSGLTGGLHFVPPDWNAIDSVIRVGIPEPVTRTPIAMPARGAASNLTDEETRTVAAYVWAISQVRGEPWPGGHRSHRPPAQASADTAAPAQAGR